MNAPTIRPFDNCPALDGYHCQTNSLAKIFHFHKHPLSEDMLLGLGAGMNFMYWHQKGVPPFIGARGNNKNFFHDIGKRTGVLIEEKSTSSEARAEKELLEQLANQEPMMIFGDMGYLPWFDFPTEYHFGGHTFVVCGIDEDTLLASDMDPAAAGLKKGFYHPITLEQLRKTRNSQFKPFPPANRYLTFDFKDYHDPTKEDIYSAIEQATESMLNSPISNFGIQGIRRTAKEITKWPDKFDDQELRLNLFTIYIFTEIGGTGGGSFRYMYSRFLEEAASITSENKFSEAALSINESGKIFTKIGHLFINALEDQDIHEKISQATNYYSKIADLEETTFQTLV
ncbi:MAG: DUF4872 domain-containing protein [Candidatus Thorarchaeota archaeon]|nr:MAG: DUF4872 domain-containing protein [Candidatus Thorarchaeota archaeon]